ncbi:MAG: penicillin-insensitive murein endopeptidase [Actinomycetota bacterium]
MTVLVVALALLAVTVIARAVDEERGAQDPGSPSTAAGPSDLAETDRSPRGDVDTQIRWRRSKAIGAPWSGRLVRGVKLPPEGRLFFTWDPVRNASPNRAYRRFATSRLLRLTLGVLRSHAAEHPRAPRVGIGDLSRRHGGDFGKRFGGLGHSSHQNGLDVDVYYPRRDGREREPRRPAQIDRGLAQDLVDRFVAAGAQFVFVGPNTKLTGPPRIVQSLAHHDNHMHVRIPRHRS